MVAAIVADNDLLMLFQKPDNTPLERPYPDAGNLAKPPVNIQLMERVRCLGRPWTAALKCSRSIPPIGVRTDSGIVDRPHASKDAHSVEAWSQLLEALV